MIDGALWAATLPRSSKSAALDRSSISGGGDSTFFRIASSTKILRPRPVRIRVARGRITLVTDVESLAEGARRQSMRVSQPIAGKADF